MEKLYIVTGAGGHLGTALTAAIKETGSVVRGLLAPGEAAPGKNFGASYIVGDVRDKKTLLPLFEGSEKYETIVIHVAGIVDISDEISDLLYDVNVNGTKNIIDLCKSFHIKRLVYISSVHTIPGNGNVSVIKETDKFSPDTVKGGYAKTKAIATNLAVEAAKGGLDTVIVQPSGIIGPYNGRANHLVQLILNYIEGTLPACVKGGYDFVDVRDVARGCLLAAEKGRKGECYILSNRHYEIKELLDMVREEAGGRRLPVLPIQAAKFAAPFIAAYAKRRHIRPLFTKYSLYVIEGGDRFSHEKASSELGYSPRDIKETIRDTVNWYKPGLSKKN